MLTVVTIMVVGIAIGYFARRKTLLIKVNDKLIVWAIYLMLFVFGVNIGANQVIVKSLPTLGLKALAIAIGGVVGSVAIAWLTYNLFFSNKQQP